MTAPVPWTEAEDQQLRDLAALGRPISEMATATDRHKSSVKRRLDRLGIHGDRTQTAAATKAKVTDAKAKRAALEVALLEDAEEMRRRMFAPTTVYNFGGKDNTFNEREVSEPPHADKLKLMQAAGIAVDRSLKISVHDSGADEHSEAKAFITQLGEALLASAPEEP